MHVAVSGWLLGPHSGANHRLLALLQHAAPKLEPGERITVLHGAGFVPPMIPGIAWRAIAIPPGPAASRWLHESTQLARCLRHLGATVLDHGFLPLPRVRVPTCLVVHDLRAVDGWSRWPRWFARTLLRRACERATVVTAPSRWTADRLRTLAPHARRIEVVPNGVTMPEPDGTPAPFPVPQHGYLLHVGHLEPRKNLGVVFDALRALPVSARPELWLAGRDAGALAALRARGAGVPLRVLGPVDDSVLAGLYRHARAVVVPSAHEGFGMPALEGLAHGRPVLASDAAALPEVVGGAGICLPVGDAGAWAAAIAATADPGDPGPRRQQAERFPWQAAADRQVAEWRRAAGAGPSA